MKTCPHKLRQGLPELPEQIKALPIDERGYPVPWFVSWIDDKPEFRVADVEKMILAVKKSLCWVCGQLLEPTYAFVIGPMCALNRISAEPPNHIECALFSAIACPFLTRPRMHRREGGLPSNASNHGESSLMRNPGVSLVWTTTSYEVLKVQTGWLFQVGDPLKCECFAEGRAATPEEIRHSIETGLPLLRRGVTDLNELSEIVRRKREAYKLLGVAA